MKKFLFLAIILGVGFVQQSVAQDFSSYKKYTLVQNGDSMPYRILLPENFEPSKKYPLVIFLHGSGERGHDNEKQLTHGAELFLQNQHKFPSIVVFPQCSQKSFWSNTQFLFDDKGERKLYYDTGGDPSDAMKMLITIVNNLFVQYKIKKDQVYIMGLSMGGMGTFELVNRMPLTFAAAIPICGGANPLISSNLKNTTWWVFHGDADNVVPPSHSQQMVKAMKQTGVSVKFTLYSGVGHNSWDAAFKEPELLKWLFSKRLHSNTSTREYNH